MLFSFLRNHQGHTLFAHCLEKKLVVEMSPLYPFKVGEDGWDEFLTLFTRYQVARPSLLDTTNFPAGNDNEDLGWLLVDSM